MPVGTIISYLGNNAPDGYLFCDGTEYNIVDYPALASHFETEFGTKNYFGGDGETTFKVPDLQGEFLRCTGTNTHANQGSGAVVGVHQDGTEHLNIALAAVNNGGQFRGINASTNVVRKYSDDDSNYGESSTYYYQGANKNTYTGSNGSLYTRLTSRPTNTSVWYCIKF